MEFGESALATDLLAASQTKKCNKNLRKGRGLSPGPGLAGLPLWFLATLGSGKPLISRLISLGPKTYQTLLLSSAFAKCSY